MKEKFLAAVEPIKELWINAAKPIKYLAVVGVIVLLLLLIPLGISGDENNLLGLSADSQSLNGQRDYSAEPINGSQKVSSEKEVAKPTVSSLKPEAVDPTNDGISEPTNAELESVYSEQLAQSNKQMSSTSTSQAGSSEQSSQATTGEGYTVQSGDNLYRIAVNNGLTLDEIMALNGMSEPYIEPGMTIRVK